MSKASYPSKYTDKQVGPSQYLADEIMERIAKKEGKTLSYKYWNSPEWKKVYLHQVTAAGKLLQELSCKEIMNFLRSPKGKKIYSLGLRKQIVEGTKLLIRAEVINKNIQQIADHGIESIIYLEEEDYTDEPEKSSTSLWEKLG